VSACAKSELHQLDLTEDENLELAGDRFHGQEFSGSKVTGPGVVNQNVEITSFGERGIECFLHGEPIGKSRRTGWHRGIFGIRSKLRDVPQTS
jgi:hypothetical protein